MIYILMGIFIALGLINLYKGKDVVIRPGINKMDVTSFVLVAILFAIVSYFMKAKYSQAIPMAVAIIFYIFTSRWARGITKNGINAIGASSMIVREYSFDKIKPIKVTEDSGYLQYPIRINGRNSIDIQRYKKELRKDIAQVLSENKVIFTYK